MAQLRSIFDESKQNCFTFSASLWQRWASYRLLLLIAVSHLATVPSMRLHVFSILLACLALGSIAPAESPKGPIGYEAARRIVADADREHEFISSRVIGQSGQGRDLMLVRLHRGNGESAWKMMFVGVQHGDEHAGKDALLHMIGDIAANPSLLPEDVDLYVVPMINPDGVEADLRRNGHDADLNRDHLVLLQPETQALYRTVREVQPHVVVDCHEYARDSGAWKRKGWLKPAIVTMGAVNSPFVHPAIRDRAASWIDEARDAFVGSDITYDEYLVGGVPPEEEQRRSTFDTDDLRNGTGIYGTLSFIIESGRLTTVSEPQADLAVRVEGYKRLIWYLIRKDDDRQEARAEIEAARKGFEMDYIPVNYFWANGGHTPRLVDAVEIETSRTIQVETWNFMDTMTVKRSVERPLAYAIPSSPHQKIYTDLLDRHGIPYEVLSVERSEPRLQSARLLAVDDSEDLLYNRFDGRQVVELGDIGSGILPSGTVLIAARGSNAGMRVCSFLEPSLLYGLYQWPVFRGTVAEDGKIPVLRVLGD
ncbi:hypothetical protein GC173_10745 [bacterium]|nr:hypothetical protein [bacterium]